MPRGSRLKNGIPAFHRNQSWLQYNSPAGERAVVISAVREWIDQAHPLANETVWSRAQQSQALQPPPGAPPQDAFWKELSVAAPRKENAVSGRKIQRNVPPACAVSDD
tara:strand:- start:39 stop:362 length:324 start_codon:yes stop_codon:yes gene_type:complete